MNEIIASVDELIALTERKLSLLRELRRNFALAQAAGVHPNDIASYGYDPSRDPRRKRRTHELHDLAPVTNFVTLKDGRRVDLPEGFDPEK